MRASALLALTGALALTACGGHSASFVQNLPDEPRNAGSTAVAGPYGSIRHVVVIIQENRSVDNLFNGLPGADTSKTGQTSTGATVTLHATSLQTCYDLRHTHAAFVTEFNGGAMNGFDQEVWHGCTAPANPAYGYVAQKYDPQYWKLAETYAFADHMFATNAGPSLPAHLYLFSGTGAVDDTNTLYDMENALPPNSTIQTGGCDSPKGTIVALINPATNDQSQTMFPCFDHKTIADTLDAANVGWRYYQPHLGSGLWFAPDAFRHIRYGTDYKRIRTPNTEVLNDIAAGTLPAVSYVIPTALESDHAQTNDGSGPAWVAQVVNAIGTSKYWKNTAIFIVWDDWGGWYDHVAPQQFNYYELGFRVPLIVVSPYARPKYVSHTQHEFGSILHFIEETYHLPTLGYTDARADDLRDMFDFSQTPLTFTPIPGPSPSAADASDTRIPDNDGD